MSELRLRLLDSAFVLNGPATTLDELARVAPSVGGHAGATAIAIEVEPHESPQEVLTLLNMTALAQCRSFAVHAGVVGGASGAIAIPAVSGAGKSTLTAACVRLGLTYLSDEALVVAWDTGEVLGYPKWLSLSSWSAEHVGLAPFVEPERAFSARELGAVVETGPVPLAHVVLPRRASGEARLTPISRARAANELLTMSFNHYQQPARAFSLAAELARGSQAWELEYADAAAGAALLRDAFGQVPVGDATKARSSHPAGGNGPSVSHR